MVRGPRGPRRIRLVAYGARLESVLSASSQGFESPILRQSDPGVFRDRNVFGTALTNDLITPSPRNYSVASELLRRLGSNLPQPSAPETKRRCAPGAGRLAWVVTVSITILNTVGLVVVLLFVLM